MRRLSRHRSSSSRFRYRAAELCFAVLAIVAVTGAYAPSAVAQCDPQELGALFADDAEPIDWFGYAVATNGSVVGVGSPLDDDNGASSGAVYLFAFDGQEWIQIDKLLPDDGGEEDIFGYSLAMDGELLVVGALGDADNGTQSGSVYVFRYDGAAWIQEAKLIASDGEEGDNFGQSVDVDGDVIVIGAWLDDHDLVQDAGSVYVFEHNGAAWQEAQKITSPDGDAGDYFGWSVALSDDFLIVGAPYDDEQAADAGAAYIYDDLIGTWMLTEKLMASDGALQDIFGQSVSIDGLRAVVGAWDADISQQGADEGAVYVFELSSGVWSETAKLIAFDGEPFDGFGWDVGLFQDSIVVGAIWEDEVSANAGAAYIFHFNGAAWISEEKLLPSQGFIWSNFGHSIDLVGNTAAFGAPLLATFDEGFVGATYVWDLGCPISVPAEITDINVVFGSHVFGGVPEVESSDDVYFRARSAPGFSAIEPDVCDIVIGATTSIIAPSNVDITIESVLDHPNGITKLRLKNWNTGFFEQVHSYTLGTTEFIEVAPGVDLTNRVEPGTGRIELSVQQVVPAVFSLSGFRTAIDWVELIVR